MIRIQHITVDSHRPYELAQFWSVPEDRAKNSWHLDLMPLSATRDEEVERLLAAGATLVADHRVPDGRGWVVLADPEGNQFCVERGQSERG